MLLYNTSAASSDPALIEVEIVAATGLSVICTVWILLNELHRNPTDMDNKRFFTQGTVFLQSNPFSVITPLGIGFKNVGHDNIIT